MRKAMKKNIYYCCNKKLGNILIDLNNLEKMKKQNLLEIYNNMSKSQSPLKGLRQEKNITKENLIEIIKENIKIKAKEIV